MILVEIICDLQDERARGRSPCYSRNNRNPQAQDALIEVAARKARREAEATGWTHKLLQKLGRRMGWICPVCHAMAEADEAARAERYLAEREAERHG